jgi:peroxiredoxin Q/BCP
MLAGFLQVGLALEVGDEAPPFRLVGSDGKTHSLEDHRGRRAVVIAWFPKAFTGG